MNVLALQLPCKSANAEQSVRLNFSLDLQSIHIVTRLLIDRGYFISPEVASELSSPLKDGYYCLMIDTEIDPHWIIPFSRWLFKKANLASLETRLEDSEGTVIVQCNLYGTGMFL
ncbi:hypothetical protein [Kiloniella antarctica]|uniref:Uncharacterized protein n=1 Tax=Kiloniella antarctica TaxID=1550907 RepID=A0ABW5BFP9_9PROT